jgi:peptide/nickel transport system permease protein
VQFAVLATDALFLGLLGVAATYAWYASRHEHLRAPWREVSRNPIAVGAAAVLLTFLTVAVLDSIHFYPKLESIEGDDANDYYASEVISAFDLVVGSMRSNVEKTYSAPFAVHAFSKETIELENGGTTRDYPRLLYGGSHLQDENKRGLDVFRLATLGASMALLVWAAFVALTLFLTARSRATSVMEAFSSALRGRLRFPFRTFFGVTGAIGVVLGLCVTLSPNYHILGTDKVGTDVLYQSLKSIRTGLVIGTLTTLVMLPFAIILGVAAGYFRGRVDDVIQYLYTTLSSIPGVLLIASAALMLEVYMSKHADQFTSLVARADLRLLALCVILGITSWTGLCRLLRGETLKLREVDFTEAARAFGVPHATIILRHMVPNIMHIVMISIVLDFSGLVLAEAVLSYINIGVDPSMESWGNMINSARLELAREPIVWWSLLAALVFMFILVLAANLFADAVRDAFDPRLRVIT